VIAGNDKNREERHASMVSFVMKVLWVINIKIDLSLPKEN
jgi:hypothetical protein